MPTRTRVQLDSIVFEPKSVVITGNFPFSLEKDSIFVDADPESVEVCYRRISALLTQPRFIRNIESYDESRASRQVVSSPIGRVEKEQLFNFPGVNKFGSISRGISFGNRRNILVNSNLNLQIDGQVSDNLFLSAVITDQNIPYQPEGNTRQIRDFDNVFIKLYNDKFSVTAGDIVISNNVANNYFMKYYKNIQGLQMEYKGSSGNWHHKSGLSAAASKGKFSSSILKPIDGLLGPYKLTGPSGERFIVILANSERVFLNGRRLNRGFDQDYIIDYNLGEITFNPHVVITQFSVINVDFEYAEQFYTRSNITFHEGVTNDKVSIHVNYYREGDSPNGNIGFSLNEADRKRLQSIGDNSDLAFIANVDTVVFDNSRILYVQKDTIDNDGNPATIFLYSTDPTATELFSPSFSQVSEGNGDYVLRETSSNGRIYDWVSPINGKSQGNYLPGAIIPLPNSRQMITTAVEVKISDFEKVISEVAISNRDLNLYSSLDDEDNTGVAYFGGFHSKGRPGFIEGYKWDNSIQLEVDHRDFTFIDRYRPILFERNWNSRFGELSTTKDFILLSSVSLLKDPQNKVNYFVSLRNRGTLLNGWQQGLTLNQEWGKAQFISSHFIQHSSQLNNQTKWLKSKTDLSLKGRFMRPGYVFEMDRNTVSERDSVLSSLMNFQSHEFYLINADTSESKFRASYMRRTDRTPIGGEVKDFVASDNINVSYEKYLKSGGNLNLDFNYRNTFDRVGSFAGEKEVLSGRMIWNQTFLKGSIRQNFSYSTGNSRELRREFVYIPVNQGEGTHTWRDTNKDGIQDLNEFFEAINPDERNYIKLFTPTDEYITAFQTTYLHTLGLRFPMNRGGSGGVRSVVSKFSVNINLNIDFKTTSPNPGERLLPFGINLFDPNVIATRANKRFTLFFNRNGRGFASDVTLQTLDSKSALTQGFELREGQDWLAHVKFDLGAAHTLRISSLLGKTTNNSDFLNSRNFEIVTQRFSPQLIWQPDNMLRVVGGLEWKQKRNQLSELSDEESRIFSVRGEVTINKKGLGSIRSEINLLNIDFTGDPASYTAYLMLDGLQPGRNQTWQVSWQQKVAKGIQISLLYNGRKSEDQRVVNTGNMQVTAFF